MSEHLTPTKANELLNRLRRIEGQSRGLQRMIEEGRPCEDVFTQIAAIKAALDRVGLLLVTEQMRACLQYEAETTADCTKAIEEAIQSFLLYTHRTK